MSGEALEDCDGDDVAAFGSVEVTFSVEMDCPAGSPGRGVAGVGTFECAPVVDTVLLSHTLWVPGTTNKDVCWETDINFADTNNSTMCNEHGCWVEGTNSYAGAQGDVRFLASDGRGSEPSDGSEGVGWGGQNSLDSLELGLPIWAEARCID